MKQKISKWELLLVVGLMLILVVGLWATSGSGLKFGSQVLAASVPAVITGGGNESSTILPPGTGAGKLMPAALSGSGAAGQVTFWTGTESLSGDNNLYWDNTNKRLGIGTATPSRLLHLKGNICLFERNVNSAGFIIDRTGVASANRWVFGADEPTGFVIKTYPVDGGAAVEQLVISKDDPATGANESKVGIGTTSPTRKLDVRTDSNVAVYGENTGSSNYGAIAGGDYGVWGSSGGSYGLKGSSGTGTAVYGNSSNGTGVYGESTSTVGVDGCGPIYGVSGTSTSGSGVYGRSTSSNGVYGGSDTGTGVFGWNQHATLGGYGVYGRSVSGTAVYGEGPSSSYGYLADGTYGVKGEGGTYGVYGTCSGSDNFGYLGSTSYGVYGEDTNDSYGYLGGTDIGAYGYSNNSYGVKGEHGGGNYGALGTAEFGVYGASSGGNGVRGENTGSGNYGYLGSTSYGVYGNGTGSNTGVYGTSSSGKGVQGNSTTGDGVYGTSSTGYAGYFSGGAGVRVTSNLTVDGTLTKGSGTFKIDHPLDPGSKYLQHSFVESPDMKNVYDGNVVLDDNGEAVVELPAYFEALNRDFRYQLTAIGAPAPDLYIAQEIKDNCFKIAGGKPGMKVSWLVTGIRQDPFANAHPIVVEQEKPANEKGYYLHPKEWGQPEGKGIETIR